MSKNVIEISAEEIIDYMTENNVGIRATATHFGCSVGTVWNRINEYEGKKKDLINDQLSKNTQESHKKLKQYNN